MLTEDPGGLLEQVVLQTALAITSGAYAQTHRVSEISQPVF